VKILQFVTQSLGDGSFLVVSDGVAAAIDPQRDVRPYLEAAASEGATIRYVFETHVHNDYVSGGPELAARGAEIVAPEGSQLEFPHRAVADGDEVAVGAARLRAVKAPGHTYEHTAYFAINEQGETEGAFTGGAILMGAAGRSDLLGPDHTEELTRLQWETARRLASLLPTTAQILPTHGAGSFCSSTGMSTDRSAPLAVELGRNPLFDTATYEAFREVQLASPAPIPAYYRHMAPINRRGAKVYGVPPTPALLSPGDIDAFARAGTPVVDVRPRADFIAAHVPRSTSIEESGSFLAFVSWVLPFDAALALVAADRPQADRVTVDLFRIGYEQVRGYLPFAAWEGRPRAHLQAVGPGDVAEMLRKGSVEVLDVRFQSEHEQQPLPGAARRPIDAAVEWLGALGEGPYAVVCASGQRATTIASLVAAPGREVFVLNNAGAGDVIRQLDR
jgi:hydroxyacylglutathione hydrolase